MVAAGRQERSSRHRSKGRCCSDIFSFFLAFFCSLFLDLCVHFVFLVLAVVLALALVAKKVQAVLSGANGVGSHSGVEKLAANTKEKEALFVALVVGTALLVVIVVVVSLGLILSPGPVLVLDLVCGVSVAGKGPKHETIDYKNHFKKSESKFTAESSGKTNSKHVDFSWVWSGVGNMLFSFSSFELLLICV